MKDEEEATPVCLAGAPIRVPFEWSTKESPGTPWIIHWLVPEFLTEMTNWTDPAPPPPGTVLTDPVRADAGHGPGAVGAGVALGVTTSLGDGVMDAPLEEPAEDGSGGGIEAGTQPASNITAAAAKQQFMVLIISDRLDIRITLLLASVSRAK